MVGRLRTATGNGRDRSLGSLSRYDGSVRRTAPLAALLLLLGCHSAAIPQREYGFVHMETTGLTSGLLIPGATRAPGRPASSPDVMIVFSRDSEPDALEALGGLDATVLLPNADGVGLVVVGTLDPALRHTPSGPGRAMSEPYQEFRMARWYLRAPFLRRGGEQPPANARVERAEGLRPEDFGGQVGGDLSRFVRLP